MKPVFGGFETRLKFIKFGLFVKVIFIVWLKSSKLRAILQDRINHYMVNQVSTKKINQKQHCLKFFYKTNPHKMDPE